MQVKEVERGTFPRPKLDYVPTPCLHCEAAPCETAARDGAVYRRPDGIVMIDPEKARGQDRIVHACPYRVIFWNADLELPQKCNLCAHRLDAGDKQPRCAESCPTGALVFGDLDDPESEIARLSVALPVEPYHPEYETLPLVRYVGLPRRMVAGEVVLEDADDVCAQGVPVILEGLGVKRETVSTVFGDFEFDGLPPSTTFRVTVAPDGYVARELEVSTQTDVDLGEVHLRR
jgi:Fe-S-cluster-containing dehydrogenase component